MPLGTLVTSGRATAPAVLPLAVSAAGPRRHGGVRRRRPGRCHAGAVGPGSPRHGRDGRGATLPGTPSRVSLYYRSRAGPEFLQVIALSPARAPVRARAGAAAAAAARAAGRVLAPVPVRVRAGAAAAAGVPGAVPAVPAMAWAAATAAAPGAAAAAAAAGRGAGPAVARLVRAGPGPAILAWAGRDRRVSRRRARGRALLASGDDSPPDAGYPARRRMRLAGQACPLARRGSLVPCRLTVRPAVKEQGRGQLSRLCRGNRARAVEPDEARRRHDRHPPRAVRLLLVQDDTFRAPRAGRLDQAGADYDRAGRGEFRGSPGSAADQDHDVADAVRGQVAARLPCQVRPDAGAARPGGQQRDLVTMLGTGPLRCPSGPAPRSSRPAATAE